MARIGEFIYPWGNGHYSRMMRLNEWLHDYTDDAQIHFASKSPIYERLLKRFPEMHDRIHNILMPTPIDGRVGPDIARSVLNILLPVAGAPPLVSQISSYLKSERRLYDSTGFDLVINDGDMGSNILARNRDIPSLFVTNQFKPRLWRSRIYFYPALRFIAKQISKATKILVADSAPPYTMCEYNLNFPREVQQKVEYVGHFFPKETVSRGTETDLERLVRNTEFGYWMRTGNKSTNDGTGLRYQEIFGQEEMRAERRIVSHARDDPSIDAVMDRNGRKYSIAEALDKKIDWVQIDVGFLSEQQKDTVLDCCQYAVINGSHTVMGEILGGKSKPVIGLPVYDEHTNQLVWAQQRSLGVLARDKKQVIEAIRQIKADYGRFEQGLKEFSANFDSHGARNAARIASECLENKK